MKTIRIVEVEEVTYRCDVCGKVTDGQRTCGICKRTMCLDCQLSVSTGENGAKRCCPVCKSMAVKFQDEINGHEELYNQSKSAAVERTLYDWAEKSWLYEQGG